MNLFRSEEHVKRWLLYNPAGEDYILPVADWAKVFSAPLFKKRLEPDYLSKADEYLAEYHEALKEVGKTSPYLQYPFIAEQDVVVLSRYRIVGDYTRYEEDVLNSLKDARLKILAGFEHPTPKRENHLIWAAPGSGKTFFAQQIADSFNGKVKYIEINLAKMTEGEFQVRLAELEQFREACLCLIDEVDAKPNETWPYEILLPYLDAAVAESARTVFVMAGSSGFDLLGMKERMRSRPKGNDLLSRIPAENQFVIPVMSFGDRILIVLSQFLSAGKEIGREIRAVEKLGLYYIAVNPKLMNARQLREFAVRAVERVPPGDDRVKYDNLFAPGDPENKRFWLEVASIAQDLANKFVTIENH
jgi:hypothetical protein